MSFASPVWLLGLALVPLLAGPRSLAGANGLVESSRSIGFLVGPPFNVGEANDTSGPYLFGLLAWQAVRLGRGRSSSQAAPAVATTGAP